MDAPSVGEDLPRRMAALAVVERGGSMAVSKMPVPDSAREAINEFSTGKGFRKHKRD